MLIIFICTLLYYIVLLLVLLCCLLLGNNNLFYSVEYNTILIFMTCDYMIDINIIILLCQLSKYYTVIITLVEYVCRKVEASFFNPKVHCVCAE